MANAPVLVTPILVHGSQTSRHLQHAVHLQFNYCKAPKSVPVRFSNHNTHRNLTIARGLSPIRSYTNEPYGFLRDESVYPNDNKVGVSFGANVGDSSSIRLKCYSSKLMIIISRGVLDVKRVNGHASTSASTTQKRRFETKKFRSNNSHMWTNHLHRSSYRDEFHSELSGHGNTVTFTRKFYSCIIQYSKCTR